MPRTTPSRDVEASALPAVTPSHLPPSGDASASRCGAPSLAPAMEACMPGDKRYKAPDPYLTEQGTRTFAELHADRALTEAAYADTGLDAWAHGEALGADTARLSSSSAAQKVAIVTLKRAMEAKAGLARQAARWLEDLVNRLRTARIQGRPGVDVLALPLRKIRGDRPDATLTQMRDLCPELPRARPVLVCSEADEAFLERAVRLTEELGGADHRVHEAERRKVRLSATLVEARREVVWLFRILDRSAAIAARSGGPVPGRSREVLDQLVGVRRARRAAGKARRVTWTRRGKVLPLHEPDSADSDNT